MVWKKGKKPEQYLFTITEEFSDNWKSFKEEAKGNWFQSSWRPLIGYICAFSLMINYLISPICAGFGIVIPQADMSVMMPLLLGMLGIAGMRSVDKAFKTDTKGK